MTISLRSVATAVPPTVLRQSAMRDLLLAQPGRSRLARRLVTAAFDASAIDTRHTVVADLDTSRAAVGASGAPGPLFVAADEGAGEGAGEGGRTPVLLDPGTGARNDVYAAHVPGLVAAAARDALAASGGLGTADVSHVVTASCTGFFAPGPDYALVRDLGLPATTRRLHVGFMGCYAAFPALAAARSICAEDPDAVVLVVCVELCSLHLQASDDPDTIVSSAVFADGAAAAVVTSRPAPSGHVVLDLDTLRTTLTPVGEQDMAWTIGDHGFDMVLSRYVPAIISEHIRGALDPLLAEAGTDASGAHGVLERWAVHPGGRSVLDKVQDALTLDDAQMAPSRDVLREFGNMSSATVLFILRRLMAEAAESLGDGRERVCAMAFGPGLTVESALLTLRRSDGAATA
ncbi:type III polyketide synthase [Serinibacter arcticus]|uniref:Type III polyketide synthase n=1 Tax=Serinibacter arcticus TaxID=1655435 RepID=A0A2U1ZRY0_9MICO|nr:3-oxoacyl-[acyl-carrier-protein] synthase III C-terminal domain-containing protein [Serinibacter arcticus]PWD49745.1 type III polyketide synthase [Serinibacter arcticus]